MKFTCDSLHSNAALWVRRRSDGSSTRNTDWYSVRPYNPQTRHRGNNFQQHQTKLLRLEFIILFHFTPVYSPTYKVSSIANRLAQQCDTQRLISRFSIPWLLLSKASSCANSKRYLPVPQPKAPGQQFTFARHFTQRERKATMTQSVRTIQRPAASPKQEEGLDR